VAPIGAPKKPYRAKTGSDVFGIVGATTSTTNSIKRALKKLYENPRPESVLKILPGSLLHNPPGTGAWDYDEKHKNPNPFGNQIIPFLKSEIPVQKSEH